MKRLLLFTPFLLAAKTADSDYLAEGRWESVFQVETAIIDGKKDHKANPPLTQPPRCIRGAETVPMDFFSHPDSQDCRITDLEAKKGKVTLSSICHSPTNPTVHFTATGHYDAHHYRLNFLMWNMFDGVKIAVQGHIDGSHQGACT